MKNQGGGGGQELTMVDADSDAHATLVRGGRGEGEMCEDVWPQHPELLTSISVPASLGRRPGTC